VKTLLLALLCAACSLEMGRGESMDTSQIKQLARQIDDALAQGHIYRIHYAVDETKTPAFYDHKKELIKLLEDAMAKDAADPAMNAQSPDFIARQEMRKNIITNIKRDLTQFRERHYSCEYSMDGTGFYLRQTLSHINADGRTGPPHTTTYVSDGKIMGTFYKEDSQGVIEPATERPRAPLEFWTETAYRFSNDTLTSCVASMPALSITEDAEQLVISGDRPFEGQERTHLELRIDKATLTPVKGMLIFYDRFGKLHTEVVKTWQYQDFGGIRLPKVVIDQYSEVDLGGKLNLEKQRVFTILDFTPTPTVAKVALADMLKSNFSMYDEITGEHYISGNTAQALDQLSK